MKWKPIDFQNPDPGITPSTSKTTLFPRIVPYIHCRYQNKGNYRNSLTTISKKDTSDLPNLPWYHHFSLSTKKMENYGLVKIIRHSTKGPSKTPIHSHLFPNLLTN